jgi:hypothetical protein
VLADNAKQPVRVTGLANDDEALALEQAGQRLTEKHIVIRERNASGHTSVIACYLRRYAR